MLLSAVCSASCVGNGIGDDVAVSVAASTVAVSMLPRCDMTGDVSRGGMSVGAYVTGISRDKVASTAVGCVSLAGIPNAVSFTVVCVLSGYAAMMVD